MVDQQTLGKGKTMLYNVIFIGAGISGLMAGITLAKKKSNNIGTT